MSTLDPQQNGAMAPYGDGAIPPQLDFPLLANAQGGKLQFVTISPTTGLAVPADDNTPNQIAAGLQFPDELSATDAGSGNAAVRVTQRAAICLAPSTIANDGFAATDVGTPFWIADTNTPGKLSHTATKNRSLGGIVLGLVKYGATGVRLLGGVVGQLLGRAAMVANAINHGWYNIADAAANTATAERAIGRTPIHGPVTSVTFTGAAVAGDNTDYATITIAKRGLADAYAAATTIATYDTRITGQSSIAALTPTSLVLVSAAMLNLLETDILTIVTTKGNAGKVLTGLFLVNGKAI